jgi:hypothetical protein
LVETPEACRLIIFRVIAIYDLIGASMTQDSKVWMLIALWMTGGRNGLIAS